MIILVLNCGSSSVKYKLLDMDSRQVLGQGGVEKIGMKDSFLKHTDSHGEKRILAKEINEHQSAIEFILDTLTDEKYGAVESLDEIHAVGHRVVHGGEKFNESVIITDDVIKSIEACKELAPLHNQSNLLGIYTVSKLMPNIPQIAVFDTAFHQTMPEYAYMYGIPYSIYEKYSVRRYGFHGTSHRYVSQRACEILNVPYTSQRIITCHIGNGASIAAIKNGKCIDTSMGFTPAEGLLMGTRCGDIDLGIILYMMEKENMDKKALSDLFNKNSGMIGLTGSSDLRDIEKAANEGDKLSRLALDIYAYRIKKYIGAYFAALGGVDIIVFTGGVGENQNNTRWNACSELEALGIILDKKINENTHGTETLISTDESNVKVIVVPTDEEYVIAQDTLNLLPNG